VASCLLFGSSLAASPAPDAAHPGRTCTHCYLPVLQTTYYVALFMLPLGDAVTINLIGPPVTAVLARLLLKEPLG
jgi:hypothetical protein